MNYLFCLDATYYTGSVIYTLNYIDYLNIDNYTICSPFIHNDSPLTKKYNIIKYNKNLITDTTVLIINDIYCIQILEELVIKPKKIILMYHNGYKNVESLYVELKKRNTTTSNNINEFKYNICKSDEIIIVNEGQRCFFNFYNKPITLLWSSIKPTHIPINIKKEKNIIRMLCVATFCPRKNQLKLIEIFKKIKFNKKVELYLVGLELNHPHKYYLEYNKECLTHKNECIKIFNASDSFKYYDLCDIFVFFSKSEQGPLVVLEALNNGLPVITSNCGNVSNMINNNGFIFNNYDDAEQYMCEIVNDDQLRLKLCNNTRIDIHKWYADHPSKCDIFKKIIFNAVTIVIDFDNTIVDYETQFLKKWNMINNDNKTDMTFIMGKLVDSNFHDEFYKNVLPYTNALESLHKLNKLPHCIIKICTLSENSDVTLQKEKWIEKYLDKTWVDRLISIENGNKENILCDIIIDDNPNLVTNTKKIIYYNQQYNQHIQSKSLIPNFTWDKYNILCSYIHACQ